MGTGADVGRVAPQCSQVGLEHGDLLRVTQAEHGRLHQFEYLRQLLTNAIVFVEHVAMIACGSSEPIQTSDDRERVRVSDA